MNKHCELCKGIARIHCESDDANLCFDCDAKVHSANFLVARHSRNFLCHVCQSPSPWSTDGTESEPLVFLCYQCDKQEAVELVAEPSSPPPLSDYSSGDED